MGKKTLTDLTTIYDHIADGGSLTAYCRSHKLKYSSTLRDINSNPISKQKLAEAIAARDEWSKEAVLAELRLIALTDLREIFDDKGAIRPDHEWPESLARAISSLEVEEEYFGVGSDRRLIGYTKKIKLWDKLAALEKIGKIMGLIVEKHEVNFIDGLADRIREAREKVFGRG